jgi:hypothetical protein
MVSSLADIPSAGAAKMVGGKLVLPAQTAADCAKVYIIGSSANLYLNAEGLNDPVLATSGHGDCWTTAALNDTGEFIYTGSGNCLAENKNIGRVVMQTCNGKEWQEWQEIQTPGYPGYEWENDQVLGLGYMATNSLVSGTYVYATGTFVDQWTEWYR